MMTAGEVGTIVGLLLAAIMTILTFRSNAAAASAREATTAAREATAVAVQTAKEAAVTAREDAAFARQDAAAIATKLEAIHSKADVIEHATNSAAARDAALIASQEKQMEMLRDTIAELRKVAALAAQAAAGRTVSTLSSDGLAENTALTREIRDAVVPKQP
jgi:hypothetical protein